ncbi:MAG: FAD:protein FMN transferase [Planctomycetales bacterium]
MPRPKKSSRRKFLQGKAKSAPVGGDTVTTDSLADWVTDPHEEAYLIRIGRRAMACQFQVFLNAGQYADDSEIAIAALDEIDALEAMLTVYRRDSEVAQLNRQATAEVVTLSDPLAELVELSLELFELTDGAFDMTAGPLAELWGQARRSGAMPTNEALRAALANVGSQYIRFDQKKRQLRFLRPGVAINFGGIGKGFAIEAASNLLRLKGIENFLFHGGRSSVLACGKRASGRGEEPWRVGLVHPLRPTERLAEILLADRSLSTSGSQSQSFHYQGRRYGHILDPRTGSPADTGVLSATVLHPSAAWADAISTAFFVMGPQEAMKCCKKYPETSAILVLPGRGTASVEIQTYGLDSEDMRLVYDQKVTVKRQDA